MIVGLDLSNSHTGVAALLLDGPRRPALVRVESLRMSGTADAFGGALRVFNAVRESEELQPTPDGSKWDPDSRDGWRHPPPARVAIEIPPATAREDVHHGGQAAIGWSLGYLQGMVEHPLRRGGRRIDHVHVSLWRQAMLEWSTRWGVLAQAPPREPPPPALEPGVKRQRFDVERDGSAFRIVWAGCGHTEDGGSLERLQASPPVRCARCVASTRAPAPADPAEWRRQQWKKLAVELVARHWPEPYERFVIPARRRARTEKPDHELEGVSDGCEAVWIACSLLGA